MPALFFPAFVESLAHLQRMRRRHHGQVENFVGRQVDKVLDEVFDQVGIRAGVPGNFLA